MNGSENKSALALGYVMGAHGIQGALRLRLHDADSTSVKAGLELSLRDPEGREVRRCRVSSVAPKPGSSVLRVCVAGVQTREDAEALRGLQVWVEREALHDLANDEFYLADLMGRSVERAWPDAVCAAAHSERRQVLGTIVGVASNGAQDLFEVRYGVSGGGRGKTWLLPVLPHFLIDISDARVLVDLPEGLLPAALETS